MWCFVQGEAAPARYSRFAKEGSRQPLGSLRLARGCALHEMPEWVADKARRAEKIRSAKAELEAERAAMRS